MSSTTVVASNPFSRSVFSRSTRRGHSLTNPSGAIVSCTGFVSQA